jgi:hypothetical protein
VPIKALRLPSLFLFLAEYENNYLRLALIFAFIGLKGTNEHRLAAYKAKIKS